jgi:hypothetical protein
MEGLSVLRRIPNALEIEPDFGRSLYATLFDGSSLTKLTYWLEIFFAAGIATFGLVLNSPAVIIGAMLISPLMTPIMATGLAIAIGDVYLGVKAVVNLVASVGVSIGLSAAIVSFLPFHSPTEEILSSTNPNLLDKAWPYCSDSPDRCWSVVAPGVEASRRCQGWPSP